MANLSHLDALEAEAIYIIREVAAECDNPVMLYSIVFGTVRYMVFLYFLYRFSMIYMALFYFMIGPMFDFLYLVMIYAVFVNRMIGVYDSRKGKEAWKWL